MANLCILYLLVKGTLRAQHVTGFFHRERNSLQMDSFREAIQLMKYQSYPNYEEKQWFLERYFSGLVGDFEMYM